MDRIRIELGLICNIKELGTEFELPDSPAIREALSTIQIACQNEVNRREREEVRLFLAQQFAKLNKAIREGSCTNTLQKLMLETVNFKRKNKFDL